MHLNYLTDYLYRSPENELSYVTEVSARVGVVKLFPGINFNLYRQVFDLEHTDAVIIETYGAGNAPKDDIMIEIVSEYIKRGGIVLNITQCSSGSVQQGLYKSSSTFSRIGVLSGGDMTMEAAVTKLMICVDPENIEGSIVKVLNNLRGERSDL